MAEAHFEAIRVEDVGVVRISPGPLCMPAIPSYGTSFSRAFSGSTGH